MGLFDRKKDFGRKGTTKDFFLGNPEAEGEGLDSNFSFSDFFHDFMDISNEISKGKFLILGRKGSGKSAYAKYVKDYSDGTTDSFACLLKNNDIDFESIIQRLPEDLENKNVLLFEWIILTQMIKMIIGTKRAVWSDNVQHLEKFYKNNAGVVQLDKLALVGTTSESNFTLNIDSLVGILSSKIGKKWVKEYTRAPFYHFISPLRDIIRDTLKYEVLSDIDFIVMFDDLDVTFSLKNQADRSKLMDLLRVARDYNTNWFKGTKSKILVFLRDDIARRLEGVSSDKTKILGSYGYTINWYDHADARADVNKILLRQLINRRISANFNRFGYRISDSDPWQDFARDYDPKFYGKKTAFKFILDCTFYRPRDLLNIFKDIGKHEYRLPLSATDIFSLLKTYAISNFGEITDEISVIFDSQQIKQVKSLLRDVSKSKDYLPFSTLKVTARSHGLLLTDIETLVDYSLLIPYDKAENKHFFPYREDIPADNLEGYYFTTPNCVNLYFNPNKVLHKPRKKHQ